VEITDPAIIAAVTYSQRYITDRQLPDKAIDLIDEAASQIRMEIDSKPESMDKLERKLIQLKIERMALKKDDCWVSDFHAVMDFVFFFQSTQDGNRILFAGFID
jgi:ATP-dependent Clp protease ATP-binding subunit ClpA